MQRRRALVGQVGRFLVVGVVAFGIDFGGFLLLHTLLGVPYVLASVVSLTASVLVSYVLSVRYVFAARPGRNVPVELALFVAISVVAVVLNQAVLVGAVEGLGMSPEAGKIVATAVVLVFNFVSRKLLIERRGGARDDASDASA